MSIFKKISILFIISFILMAVIGSWIDNINSKKMDKLIKEKYIHVVEEIIDNIQHEENLNEIFKKHKLRKKESIDSINNQILYVKKYTSGEVIILKESFEDEFVIEVRHIDKKYIFKTPDEENLNDKTILNILISLDIFILILIFLYIFKLLSPIKIITKELINFANGDLSRRININSKDEIGVLADSFNKMASNLQNSIKTREELLRDIGHELRTPIAKGKFAIEKIDNSFQKDFLKKIFIDLETLTNELIELEKIDLVKLNIATFNVETLVIESLGKLYLEDESKIEIDLNENFKIDGDLYYLSMAFKNLIDNALKYAVSYPIIIKSNLNEISISNKGKKLSKELEYYLKPFTQELTQRDGFGLGLSIVKKIIDKHHFKIDYSYNNDSNVFKIYLLKSS